MTNLTWTGGGGNTDFRDAKNWNPLLVPVFSDTISIASAVVTVFEARDVDGLQTSGVVDLVGGPLGVANGLGGISRNAGQLTLFNGGIVMSGTFENTGVLILADRAPSAVTGVGLSSSGILTLTGGGSIVTGTFSEFSGTIRNVDNTISGTGRITQPFINEGVIALLSTVASVTNIGTIRAAGSTLLGATKNTGTIEAIGSNVLTLFDSSGITIDNTGGVLRALNGGTVNVIARSRIIGGTLLATSGGTIALSVAHLDGTVQAVTNAGSLDVGDAWIDGTLHNTGSIRLLPDVGASLSVHSADATLSGGGTIVIGSTARILGSDVPTTLHNLDNVISGSGTIGEGRLIVENIGRIVASAGTLQVVGTITGSGTFEIAGGATLRFTGNGISTQTVSSGQTVRFLSSGSETLDIAVPGTFAASLSGFGVSDALNLQNPFTDGFPDAVAWNAGTLSVTSLARIMHDGSCARSGALAVGRGSQVFCGPTLGSLG